MRKMAPAHPAGRAQENPGGSTPPGFFIIARHKRIVSGSCASARPVHDVGCYFVDQQREGPGMPEKVEDVDGACQGSRHEHPELFDDVRLGIKRSKTQGENEENEESVIQQVFHGVPIFGALRLAPDGETWAILPGARRSEREKKRRSLPRFPFGPHLSAVALDDAPDGRQPDAGAGKIA